MNYFKIKAAEFYLSCDSEAEVIEAVELLYKLNEEGNDDLAIEHVEVWSPFENSVISDILMYIEDLEKAFEDMYELGTTNKLNL